MTRPKFAVGDKVWISYVEARRYGHVRHGGVVTKVGRTLVTVERPGSYPEKYRIETGVQNGQFPRYRIDTDAQLEDQETRAHLTERLAAAGVRLLEAKGYREPDLSTEALAQIVDVVVRDRST